MHLCVISQQIEDDIATTTGQFRSVPGTELVQLMCVYG